MTGTTSDCAKRWWRWSPAICAAQGIRANVVAAGRVHTEIASTAGSLVESMEQLVRGEVVYDIHFVDRWQYHWPMEEGLVDKKKIPGDAWFFLKTMLFARDADWRSSSSSSATSSQPIFAQTH